MRYSAIKSGDIQIVTRFLWLPLTIDRETRWLEFATWARQWVNCDGDGGYWTAREWDPKEKS